MVTLTIDGKKVTVKKLSTILDAAKKLDIPIPTLCHHPELSPFGGCRLCIVEVKDVARPVIACTTLVKEGMEIITTSPNLEKLRKTTLELLLSDHPNDCMLCERAGDCTLQELAYFYGIMENRFGGERRIYEKRDGNPFIERDIEKCILCGQCVRTCDEIQGVGAIDFAYRGLKTKICPPFEKDLDCEFCGQCVEVCPTGALTGKMWAHKGRQKDIKEVDTVCPYCGCGCNITLHVRQNEVIRVTSKKDKWNEGWLCVKGRFGYSFINSPDRLTKPLIRIEPKDKSKVKSQKSKVSELQTPNSKLFREASWDDALDYISAKMKEIKERHGADSIAGLSSARCTTEENYLFQKFMRAAVGTNNVDHCARLCHAPTVASLATIFGSGAMTNSIREIEGMEVIFVIGSNTKETHPVIANRMLKALRKGTKLIVADPRRVPLVRFSEIFLRLKPGTDVALLNGMAHVILKEGLHNDEFINERTEGFDEWKKSIETFTPQNASKITGIPEEEIIKAAKLYGGSRKAGIFYAMGITQHTHGTDNVNAVANLALLTGNIGREHTGISPLRGQNNVQGACDAGCLPNVYPGYQRVDIPMVKKKFEDAWGVQLSDKEGLELTEMVESAFKGELKALYILGENPMLTDPNIEHTRKALKKLEFIVVQDIFFTETAALADVVLPATCFAEKNGTFINTERKVQLVRKAVEPPGDAKEDSWIIAELSNRIGYPMKYSSVEEISEELGSVWPALSGISYSRIRTHGIHWPCPTKDHPGTEYLYKAGFPRGKVSFTPVKYVPPAEVADSDYPFILTTGRNLFQYHGGSMTRRVAPIEKHAGEPYVEINTEDAKKAKIKDGEKIKVSSRRGQIEIKARVTDRISSGVLFIPMHYREAAANVITTDALDPHAKTPEFKVCAVKIEK